MSIQIVEPDFSKYPQHRRASSLAAATASAASQSRMPRFTEVGGVDDGSAIMDDDNDEDGERIRLKRKHRHDSATFKRRVSFDTIGGGAGGGGGGGSSSSSRLSPSVAFSSSSSSNAGCSTTNLSYYTAAKHDGYKHTYGSRTFLISMTHKSKKSDPALEWMMKSLIHDNDELVLLRLFHQSTVDSHDAAEYQQEAQSLLNKAITMATKYDHKINIQCELGVGKVKTVVHKMLALYQPSLVIVGSRFSNYKRMRYKKSISRYLIARSPVPVIMVTPSTVKHINRSPKEGDHNGNDYFANLFNLTMNVKDGSTLKPIGTSGSSNPCSEYSISSDEEESDDDNDDNEDLDDEDIELAVESSSDSEPELESGSESLSPEPPEPRIKRTSSIKKAWKLLRSPSASSSSRRRWSFI